MDQRETASYVKYIFPTTVVLGYSGGLPDIPPYLVLQQMFPVQMKLEGFLHQHPFINQLHLHCHYPQTFGPFPLNWNRNVDTTNLSKHVISRLLRMFDQPRLGKGVVDCSTQLTRICICQKKWKRSKHQGIRLADKVSGRPALKISWGPPTANLWPDWSPQKRVNRDKLDQR